MSDNGWHPNEICVVRTLEIGITSITADGGEEGGSRAGHKHTVSSNVICGGGDLLHQISADVLKAVLELNALRHSDTVLRNLR